MQRARYDRSVLSIGKVNGVAGRDGAYYTDSVASGAEDYYAGKGEAAGYWTGSGAELFEVAGEASTEAFHRVINGIDPATGEILRRAKRHEDLTLREGVVRGFDLTFSAPKSVSVLFAAGDPEVAREINAALDAATAAGLEYLESTACVVRRGRGGKLELPGDGFVGVAFRHRTSRAGDPQLHTHAVIANMSRGPDGKWSALDATRLYTHGKTAGFIFQAELRAELTRRLGLAWEREGTPGVAEVAGVPASLRREFSTRRAEIEEAMALVGGRTATSAQVATLTTRPAKDHTLDGSLGLREGWQQVTGAHGLTPDVVQDRILDRQPRLQPHLDGVQALVARLSGPAGLTREQSTFDARHVLQAVADSARSGATYTDIERATTSFLEGPGTVAIAELEDPGARERGEGPVVRRRGDGRVVKIEQELYTTPDLLAVEQRLLDRAKRTTKTGAGQVPPAIVEQTITQVGTLSDEQADMVRAVTGRGDGIHVVRASAGTGKTFTLNAARQAWQHAGIPVAGVALSRRAALELRQQAGLDMATSIAALEHDIGRYDDALPHGAVLIVDEAAMVDTRTIERLSALTERAGGMLLLVGDDRQLTEIGAGGAFNGLATRLGATTLETNRRQRDPVDIAQEELLRAKATGAYLRAATQSGQVVFAANAQQARDLLLTEWLRDRVRVAPEQSVMLAATRADVAWLNLTAREALRQDGQLQDDQLVSPHPILEQVGWAIGDLVICRQNAEASLGVINGLRGQIITIDQRGGEVTLRTFENEPRELTLPGHYVQDGKLEHAYALTANLAQGMTVEHVAVLGNGDSSLQWLYSAMTRHREQATFYTVAPPSLQPGIPTAATDERDAARALGTSRAKTLATDSPATLANGPRPDELVERARALRATIARVPDRRQASLEHARQDLERAEEQLSAARERLARAIPQTKPFEQRAVRTFEAKVSELRRRIDADERKLADPGRDLGTQQELQTDLVATEHDLRLAVSDDLRAASAVALIEPQAHTLNVLGPRPESSRELVLWEQAAQDLERYRHIHMTRAERARAVRSEDHRLHDLVARRDWRAVGDARQALLGPSVLDDFVG